MKSLGIMLLGHYMYFSMTSFLLVEMRKVVSLKMVGCFVCHSFNGSDPGCADPFSPNYHGPSSYSPKCQQGMRGRKGTFPAYWCLKMNGVRLSDGVEVMVRTCSLQNMGYQCGVLKFDNHTYKGCLSTCIGDACNHATSLLTNSNLFTITAIITIVHLCRFKDYWIVT